MKLSSWIERIHHPILRESLLLMRVDRPVGTWLLLWPSLWSLMGASAGFPEYKLVFIFILGTFIMRSAGCVANDLADRDFDPHVQRTCSRPLARKAISVRHALFLLIFLLTIALSLAWQLNFFSLLLCIPGAFLALSYPWTKRLIDAPQLYLGISFGWSALIAWAAVRDTLDWPAWTFFFATVFWAAGYDTIYGMADRNDDKKIGIRSTALFFGDHSWIAVGVFYLIASFFWFLSGYILNFSFIYYFFCFLSLLHLLHQVILTRKKADNEMISIFKRNQWTGGIVLFGIISEKIS
ncbi:MAG: 4-hydroxybenzoate octaprenyltransferase [Magnetococcales bacterium]|nr:4-hydroxybenzoate octaprenyltransferase [Magnetococcales bacterium]